MTRALLWPFRRRFRVTYHLRSGASMSFKCSRFTRSVKNGNDLSGVEVTGGNSPFYTRLDAIDAIELTRVWF